jgi:DNA repair exonuclease SbcCD ATPase subunit
MDSLRFLLAITATCVLGATLAGDFARAAEKESSTSEPLPPSQKQSTDPESTSKPTHHAGDEPIEQDVLQMVEDHLPEIKVLLDQLRRKAPRQYDLAIRNLAKSSRRLQLAKKRGAEAFEAEVRIVQAQSSINLLIAKLKLRDSEKDHQALFDATKRLQLAEIARARHEVAQLQARLAKMRQQVTAAERRLSDKQSKMNETIEKSFQGYLRRSGRK